MEPDWLIDRLTIFIPLVLSLSVHEWAHAWSAFRLGDDTAKLQGRMSLNPLVHIDPIGTVLLPLLGVPFGWAKPVPVEPRRFRPTIHPKTGMMIVAAAGPISNVCLALLCVAALAGIYVVRPEPTVVLARTVSLLHLGVLLNVLLAAFNLIPIPPLDGSRIADALVPNRFRPLWYQFCRMGPVLLIGILLLPMLLDIHLFDGLMRWTSSSLLRLRLMLS
jgi:Zn-dependent protease